MKEERLIDILVNPQTGNNHKELMNSIGLLMLAHNHGHVRLSVQSILAFDKLRKSYDESFRLFDLTRKELESRKCDLVEDMIEVGMRMLNLYKDELLAFLGVDSEVVMTKGPYAVKYTDAELASGF
jgi:hypothetical protein